MMDFDIIAIAESLGLSSVLALGIFQYFKWRLNKALVEQEKRDAEFDKFKEKVIKLEAEAEFSSRVNQTLQKLIDKIN